MDKIVVTLVGVIGIVGIYWFFFGKKEESTKVKQQWNVLVSGGYQPSTILIPNGRESTITFTRNDPSSCLEEVVLEEFRVKKFLPIGKPVTITLSPTQSGTFGIHCGMNMFHGKVIVV